VALADGGAPQGDPKDMPLPMNFVEGWRIRKPDMVFEMSADFEIPATGTIEYQYIVVPTGFTEDKWVQMAEARPGNRALVHHIVGYLREPGSKWLEGAKPGEPFVPRSGRMLILAMTADCRAISWSGLHRACRRRPTCPARQSS